MVKPAETERPRETLDEIDAVVFHLVDVSESDAQRRALEASLSVEHLLTQSIQALQNIDALPRALGKVLALIGDFFKADRSYIFRIRDDALYNTYEWCGPNVRPEIDNLQGIELGYIDRWMNLFREGLCLVCHDVEQIQDEAPDEYRIMHQQDITSYVEAPIVIEDRIEGFIGIDNPLSENALEHIAPLMESLAHCITSAIIRQRTQDALANSQEMYRRATESAGLVMWEYDIERRTITLSDNEATREDMRVFGLPQVIEDVPESLVDRIDEADVGGFLEMYRKVNTGQNASCDMWYRALPGVEPRCKRTTYTVMRDEYGRPVRAYGIGQNITAQRKIEERYAHEVESLEHTSSYRMIAKGHSNLTQNKVLGYESFMEGIFAASPGENYDEAMKKLLDKIDLVESDDPIDSLLSSESLIRRYQRGETHFEFKYRLSVAGQAPIWVKTETNAYMMPSTGDVECFRYSYDITDEIIEQQLVSKLAMLGYQELGFIYTRTGSYTVYRLDSKGRNVIRSGGGYESGLDCHLASKSIPVEDVKRIRKAMSLGTIEKALEQTAVYTFSNAVIDSSGDRRQKFFQFSYLDERHDTLFMCMSDITEQYAREIAQVDELRKAKLDADRANEAKSSFLSSVSHDIRTPLNGILGFTDLALNESDPEKKQAYLAKVKTSGELLLELINDTLELSRIESGKLTLEKEAVGGHELIDTVITALRPSAELKDIELIENISRIPDETVWIDKLKFQKIFLNLLSNAIKYTPEGGIVRASIETIAPPEHGCNRRVIVEDNGIGVDPAFLPQLFEPFSQELRPEAANPTGSGLGLSIVKRIVTIMGGTISVESTLGKGTRFTVDLPVEFVEGERGNAPTAPTVLATIDGTRVLLCEDNDFNAEIATILLRSRGVDVVRAADGRAGVELFAQSEPHSFNAVMMDVRMPMMDGREATRAIRALEREDARCVPIIAVTADAFEEDIRLNQQAGMNAFVVKPLNRDQLFKTLTELIGR